MSAASKSNEIRLTRVYSAPLKAVWDAWTDPVQAAQWWGPRGFTLTTHSKDLRAGGTWRYTMHGPDGVDYPNVTKYLEVEPCKRLVYDHGGNDDRPALFRVSVTFTEANGKTTMEMTSTLPTPEAAAEMSKFIKQAGGDSTWDRLGEYLDKRLSDKERFIINRTFEVPIALMFDAWTQPAHLAEWLAPTGFTMQFLRVNIQKGGDSFYVMSNAAGVKMYGRAQYLDIVRPNLIVYTQQFCDENENVRRHPMSPTWPESMLTAVAFCEEGPSRTRLTVTWEPFGACTPEELATFVAARSGMTQGWTGSFDKLETWLDAKRV